MYCCAERPELPRAGSKTGRKLKPACFTRQEDISRQGKYKSKKVEPRVTISVAHLHRVWLIPALFSQLPIEGFYASFFR